MKMNRNGCIRIRGLCLHNLKNLDIDIPHRSFVAVTGPSGSGRSSLVFDSIYAESQRRFVETFSPYARQFLERLPRPAAREMESLPAAVAIEQKNPVKNARSTVGTLAGLNWPARLLFFRMATLFCPGCGAAVRDQGAEDVADYVLEQATASDGRHTLYITVVVSSGMISGMIEQGWFRVLEGGGIRRLSGEEPPDSSCEFVIDRFRTDTLRRGRVIESAETAFAAGGGMLHVVSDSGARQSFSRGLHCAQCNRSFPPPSPALFSFNSSAGACPRCSGFGGIQAFDPELVVPDPSLSIEQGAVRPFETRRRWKARLIQWCRKNSVPVDVEWRSLSRVAREKIMHGDAGWGGVDAFFRKLEKKRYKPHIRMLLSRYRTYLPCPSCNGSRFRHETLRYRLAGITLPEFYALTLEDALEWCRSLEGSAVVDNASASLLEDLEHRLYILCRSGLSYLSMDRASRTLSGGEAARINMARALGSRLCHTLYCVDEPSAGLHAADTLRMAQVLRELVNSGNSVIVVDNDPAVTGAADLVIEMGPGSGAKGGRVVRQGAPEANAEIFRLPERGMGVGIREPAADAAWNTGKAGTLLEIFNVTHNNLKGIDVRIPFGAVTSVSGVSGSGKSSLAEDVLYRAVKRCLGQACEPPGSFGSISGAERLSAVWLVDQNPPSRTPRACTATALGLMDILRKVFAATDDAQSLGLEAGDFSFNTGTGRCAHCSGQGSQVIEMQFLPDMVLPCPHCRGSRFGPGVLSVRFRGRNIADVLDLTLDEAAGFFSDYSGFARKAEPALSLGLGHLKLGQALNTLSAGEIQRLKLAAYLQKGASGRRAEQALFILDEPTRGLHQAETRLLEAALRKIAGRGNCVVVVEHDLEIIMSGDWVIDLGPGGGRDGGHLIYQGPPAGLLECSSSVTGQVLAKGAHFNSNRVREPVSAWNKPASSDVSLLKRQEGESRQAGSAISITGARENNLKDVSLEIPHGKFVVITGVSGSGKSTLAFSCIFSEGQRRYMEGLSSYLRQFVSLYQRPDVDSITGLTPSVAIEQRTSMAGPMSTVATMTEVAHYLRLLYARGATPWCPDCRLPMQSMTRQEIVNAVEERWRGQHIFMAAPRITRRKGWHRPELEKGVSRGVKAFFIDGKIYEADAGLPSLSRYTEHSVYWIMAGTVPCAADSSLEEAINRSLEAGRGTVAVLEPGRNGNSVARQVFFSLDRACPSCSAGAQEADPLLFSFNSSAGRCNACSGRGELEDGARCPECGGSRLNSLARSWKIRGKGIDEVLSMEISDALEFLKGIDHRESWSREQWQVCEPLVKGLVTRLGFLEEIGLGYLPLDMGGHCLSGGEAQRIRLAAQAGSGLSGVTVVLDEPTIGLHPRDNERLTRALRSLCDTGNSVIVVEHDEETMRAADWLIDLGPGGGINGGRVVAQGTVQDVVSNRASPTGQALADKSRRSLKSDWRPEPEHPFLKIDAGAYRNLRGFRLEIPARALVVVTGVSGAGKSTLVSEVIEPFVRERCAEKGRKSGQVSSYEGASFRRVVTVDHSPIGRTPRSCPATYMGIWTEIRNLLSRVPEARNRGYGPGRFSFNVHGGRCPECSGQGSTKVSLGYLPDVYVPCSQCGGSRFNSSTLEIKWKGKSVSDILSMTIREAADFFISVPRIHRPLSAACRLGIGYLALGQPATALSGGEAQRMKLVRELSSATVEDSLYLLDEPTTGLHISDVDMLARHLRGFISAGATVVVIEHNLDLASAADWIVELGPGGGRYGGELLFSGTPKDFLLAGPDSATRAALDEFLSC